MNRRGTTMIEMLAVIGLVLPIAVLAMEIAGRLTRPVSADGRLADLVCLQLRRDAGAGAALAADGLRAGTRQWRLEDGWLCRDGAQRLRVETAGWQQTGGVVTVRLRPSGLPERILELEAKP